MKEARYIALLLAGALAAPAFARAQPPSPPEDQAAQPQAAEPQSTEPIVPDSQFEEALLGVEGVAPHYQLVVERPRELDEITVLCEGSGEGLAERVQRAIREQIGVSVAVEVLAPGSVPRSEGKAVRVVDKRV